MKKAAKKPKFLVYIDDEEYSKVALRFACSKARLTKRPVEMLYVLEPADFSSLGGVEEVIRKEQRQKALEILSALAGEARDFTGITPSLVIKEGAPEDQILSVVKADSAISILILGGAAGNKIPSWLVSQIGDKLHVPVMIVPGSLTDKQITDLT